MLVHKKIQIDNYSTIQQELYELLELRLGDLNKETLHFIPGQDILTAVPKLAKFFTANNLYPNYFVAFIRAPGITAPIHIDRDVGEVLQFELALNLPVANCTGTEMHWFDVPTSELEYIEDRDNKYRALGQDPEIYKTLKPITSLELTEPTLLRIDIPHNVTNNQNHHRMVISVRFNPQPLHLWTGSTETWQ